MRKLIVDWTVRLRRSRDCREEAREKEQEGRDTPAANECRFFFLLLVSLCCLVVRVRRMIEEPFRKVAGAYAQQNDVRKVDKPVVFMEVDIQHGGWVLEKVLTVLLIV